MRTFLVQALEKFAYEVEKTVSEVELDEMVSEANRIFRRRRKHFEEKISLGFSVGDQVEFEGKRGQVIRGELIGKSDRTAKVQVGKTLVAGKPFSYPQKWTVSWGLLRKVEGKGVKELAEVSG